MSYKSHHADGSLPDSYSLSSGSGDKSYSRLDLVLMQALTCAILLPTAAQSILGFLWVIVVLRRTGLRVFSPSFWESRLSQLAPFYKILLLSLFALWLSHALSFVCELTQATQFADGLRMAKLRLHLVMKQGFYGLFIIVCWSCVALEQRCSVKSKASLKWILVFSIALTLYMLGQRYWGWNWVHGFDAKLGDHRFAYGVYRASGFMGHPLSMAFNSMMLALLALSQGLWLFPQQKHDAVQWLCLSLLSGVQVFLTGSRYPLFLMFVLSFGLLAWFYRSHWMRKKVWLFFGIFSFCSILVLAFGLDPNLRGRILELGTGGRSFEENFDRIIFWKVNLSLALDHPFAGTGLLSYPGQLLDYYHQAGYTYYERKYAAHNIFIQTFADMGFIGISGLLAFLVGLGVMGWRLMKVALHPGLVLLSLAVLMSGLMQNNLRDSEFLFALWASIALTFGWLVEQGMASEPTKSRTNFQNHES